MSATAEKTDPELWERVKAEVTQGEKGGAAGQWSARKAQMAVQAYKKAGGGYVGEKAPDNHLLEWEREDWGAKSGHPSGETHERYLPRKARDALSGEEYARTTAKKRADTRRGRQFSAQPKDVADKTAPFRKHDGTDDGQGGGRTKAALMAEARRRDIPGRSRMDKAALERALHG